MERRQRLLLDKGTLEKRLDTLSAGDKLVGEEIAQFCELTRSLNKAFKSASNARKRQILSDVTANRAVDGKYVSMELQTPYRELFYTRQLAACGDERNTVRTFSYPDQPRDLDSLLIFLVSYFATRPSRSVN